jgi:phage terminase large subunit GpA-like protein
VDDFADVDAVIARAMGAWRPPPRLSLSAWADRHYVLSSETAAEPGRWHTLPYQREILDSITDRNVTMVVVQKSARVGFALDVDTPLPTPTGWTTMGGVRVGAWLLDEAGRPCRVITKSPVFEDHNCYRIRFCDGSEIVADAGHRWLVESDVSIEHLSAGRRGRTGRPKPGEARTFNGVIDTETMARALRTSRGRTALAVRNAAPLELPDRRELPIPPYTLGLWLGDGQSASARITQHRQDVETASYCAEEGVETTVRYLDKRNPDNATILLGDLVPPNKRRWGAGSEWRRRLRAAGVLNYKHIPFVYMRAGFAQRLALLRGLMDSDGTIGKDGRAEFTNTNRNLVHGVYELVVSLGMKATIRLRTGKSSNPALERLNGRGRPPDSGKYLDQWRVNFKPTPEVNPFRLRRKAARVLEAAKPTITKRRRVVSVVRVPAVPVQCIEVDSLSHLFLAGREMIPTHNTLCMSVALGYFMVQDPSSILVVQPTVDDAKGFSKETVTPMLRDVPVLSRIALRDVKEKGRKDASSTLQLKAFPGGVLSLVGANSGGGLRRISRRVVMFDEVDAYPVSAGDDGDPIHLGMKRSEAFHNRKIIAGSTPLIAGSSRIEELFLAGDQRRYYVPCPHCKHMDFFTFDRDAARGHVMRWPDNEPQNAFFECRANSCVIEHKDKRWMIERGEWRPDNPAAAYRSYHLWSAVSYSPNATWGQIATEFLEAQRGGVEKLKTFINTTLGETWKDKGEAPEWERLYQRRETYKIGTVPEGVIVVTAGVDVQKDRFVFEVVGWAPNKESWSIDAGEIVGDTALEGTWYKLDEQLLTRTFRGDDGCEHHIERLAVDSGYNTQMAYAFARRQAARVFAVKGSATARVLAGSPSKVDVALNGRKLRRGVNVWPVGVDIAKSELYGWLGLTVADDGTFPSGYCHFPGHDREFFKQLTAEHLVTTVSRRTGRQRREWQVQANRQNHYLDARVYARAAAAVLGIDRLPPQRASPSSPSSPSPPAHVPAAALDSQADVTNEPRRSGWLSGRSSHRGGRGWLK